jgi:SulP family sulfate permease
MVSGGGRSNHLVLIALIQSHCIEYLFATVALAGMLQMIVGIFKLGKCQAYSTTGHVWILNGLAVIIFMAQIEQFKIIGSNGVVHWLKGSTYYI